jgi:hypothetical protein
MQTVLGADGVIGRELSRHLPEYSDRILPEQKVAAVQQLGGRRSRWSAMA